MLGLCAISFFSPPFPHFRRGIPRNFGSKVPREYSDMKRSSIAGPAGLAWLGMSCLVLPCLAFHCHLVFRRVA